MAAIDKRGNTFRIRVFVGTDANGKKIMRNLLRSSPLNLNVNVKDILVSMKI